MIFKNLFARHITDRNQAVHYLEEAQRQHPTTTTNDALTSLRRGDDFRLKVWGKGSFTLDIASPDRGESLPLTHAERLWAFVVSPFRSSNTSNNERVCQA